MIPNRLQPAYLAIKEKTAIILTEKKLVAHSRPPAKRIGPVVLILALVVLVGCGGSGSSHNGGSSPANAALQLNVGDDSSDRVAALLVNISTVTLTNSGSGTVSILSSPASVEFMHLMGALQSLSLVNVPQDPARKIRMNYPVGDVAFRAGLLNCSGSDS